MELQLSENFTINERSYIHQYLAMIYQDNHVTIGSNSIMRFLKKLSYSEDDGKAILSPEEKDILAHKLIDWIMQDEEAFIKIFMRDSSVLTRIAIPLCQRQ